MSYSVQEIIAKCARMRKIMDAYPDGSDLIFSGRACFAVTREEYLAMAEYLSAPPNGYHKIIIHDIYLVQI